MTRTRTETCEGTGLRALALAVWPQAFGYSLSLTGDRHRAEDLCQEAYLRLFAREETVDLSRPILPLILTILRRLLLNQVRRKAPLSLVEEERPDLVEDPGQGPLEEALARETGATVEEALATMPATWRAILYLRDGLGLSYREIARTVETTENSVRVTLHRARERARVLLRDRDPRNGG